MSSDIEQNPFEQEPDSEDEMDWEEVDVPAYLDVSLAEPEEEQHIEITLSAIPSSFKSKKATAETKRKGITHEERLMRIAVHKIHTVVLLANAKVRNTWINDETLQARLMSLAPITLQNEFAQIHKSRIPDQGQRGRLFEKALQHLAQWWSGTFFEVLPSGHIRNHTFDEIHSKLERLGMLHDEDELDDDTLEEILGYEIERVRGPKSLMKHALNGCGSRDVSAQLFTSLCRALGLPSRLVVSLQSVPWQPSVGKPKPTYTRKDPKGKGKSKAQQIAKGDDEDRRDDESASFGGAGKRLDGKPIPMSEKAKGKQKAQPVIRLRKQKDKGHRLGSTSQPSASRLASPDPTTTPPVFWTEVFSRPDSRWMPVDPVRGIVNKRKAFDPTPTPANTGGGSASSAAVSSPSMLPPRPQATPNNYSLPKGVKHENRMQYVIAFEEDGYARDVTRRYAREYNSKVAKSQGGSSAGNSGGKARQMWWESVLGLVKRPYQLHRDDLEDDELEANQMMEGMPTTVSGFKDHPLYALTRHLKQTDVIHPPPPDTPEIGKFRGEPVYPRSSVVSLKSAETWMRTEGRIIKAGCQPLKTIKARPGTVGKMRELEVMKDELRDAGHSVENVEVMQGLYSRAQTELYIPDPIVNGKIPKNNFGNIDLYVPSMLPRGAVHVPYKGVAKIARKLGFDHAEAVTGFEFRKRRANAVVEGVVIAAENEAVLLEAYWESQKAEEEKARIKKEEKALQNWTKLVQGLRIRARLIDEYADRGDPSTKKGKPVAGGSKVKGEAKAGTQPSKRVTTSEAGDLDLNEDKIVTLSDLEEDGDDAGSHHGDGHGGGFLVEAGDVVQAFHLPKYNPLILASSHNLFTLGGGNRLKQADKGDLDDDDDGEASPPAIDYTTYDLEDHDTLSPADGMMDVDIDEDQAILGGVFDPDLDAIGAPRTMQELLDADNQAKGDNIDVATSDLEHSADSPSKSAPRFRVPAGPTARNNLQVPADNNQKPTPGNRKTPRLPKSKKRKREAENSAEENSGTDGEVENPWEDEDGDVGLDQVKDDEDEDDAYGTKNPKTTQKRAQKKARHTAKPKKTHAPRTPNAKLKPKPSPSAPLPSDRVLRSRAPRTSS